MTTFLGSLRGLSKLRRVQSPEHRLGEATPLSCCINIIIVIITWGLGPTLLSCVWPWCISRRLAWLGCFMIRFYGPVTQASRFLPASVNYPAHLGFVQKIPVCLGQHPAMAAPRARRSVHLFCPAPPPSPHPRPREQAARGRRGSTGRCLGEGPRAVDVCREPLSL